MNNLSSDTQYIGTYLKSRGKYFSQYNWNDKIINFIPNRSFLREYYYLDMSGIESKDWIAILLETLLKDNGNIKQILLANNSTIINETMGHKTNYHQKDTQVGNKKKED